LSANGAPEPPPPAGPPAAVDGWAQSFDPKPLASYLDAEGISLLVASGGEVAEDARTAARALRKALRATGKTRLVMDDGALGDLSGLSDKQIVERCASLPAEVVAVTRVFPGSDGHPPTAVVAFYAKRSGSTLATFTVEAGSPLPPRAVEPAQATAAPVTETVAHAVPETKPQEKPEEKPAAAGPAQYEDSYIWSPQKPPLEAQTGAALDRWSQFYRGKAAAQLSGEDFYVALGRSDLAASYRARATAKTWLTVSGLVGLVGGASVIIAGALTQGPCTTEDSLTQVCVAYQQVNPPLLIGGAVIGAAGLAVAIVGFTFNSNPVGAAEARSLVEEYDRKLRKELGLPPDDAPPPPPEKAVLSWDVGGFTVPGGGGLSLRLRL
jgi:hypothetical protein